MSQRDIRLSLNFNLRVGWDRPLGTFYALVECTGNMDPRVEPATLLAIPIQDLKDVPDRDLIGHMLIRDAEELRSRMGAFWGQFVDDQMINAINHDREEEGEGKLVPAPRIQQVINLFTMEVLNRFLDNGNQIRESEVFNIIAKVIPTRPEDVAALILEDPSLLEQKPPPQEDRHTNMMDDAFRWCLRDRLLTHWHYSRVFIGIRPSNPTDEDGNGQN